jgi:hypothetical protein
LVAAVFRKPLNLLDLGGNVMKRITAAGLLIIAAVTLAGCDPGVHIAWQKQFDRQIDSTCIASALRSVSSSVQRDTYVSEGSRGFPKGTEVTQFGYSDPSDKGYYNLDVATLPGGTSNYWHGWSKLGTEVPTDERARILPLLYKANRAVATMCGLSFDDVIPEQGGG